MDNEKRAQSLWFYLDLYSDVINKLDGTEQLKIEGDYIVFRRLNSDEIYQSLLYLPYLYSEETRKTCNICDEDWLGYIIDKEKLQLMLDASFWGAADAIQLLLIN